MGGDLFERRADGAYVRYPGWEPAMGLSALDLDVMGLIPPEEVPDTFRLANTKEIANNVFAPETVPVAYCRYREGERRSHTTRLLFATRVHAGHVSLVRWAAGAARKAGPGTQHREDAGSVLRRGDGRTNETDRSLRSLGPPRPKRGLSHIGVDHGNISFRNQPVINNLEPFDEASLITCLLS